ncbi:type II toxin-antitoxin system Phd/YefM family antitoxin [Nonomuraea sp. NPDC050680]|uniref:type II toxin-antitoxin system Phd/YefM family antitoxin n=1 Tax=Nonomuraea sp. NPDC050680 TaxID=3154630 RepID=UPI0033E9651F
MAPDTTAEPNALGIVEARNQLGTLVARAVHGHAVTRISRSSHERAVLISEADYEELLRARRELEAGHVTEAIAAHARGEREMMTYDSKEALYADLDLPTPSERS